MIEFLIDIINTAIGVALAFFIMGWLANREISKEEE